MLVGWSMRTGICCRQAGSREGVPRSGVAFPADFSPPARDFEEAGGADCLHSPPTKVTSSSSSSTANAGPKRWGVPECQRSPRGTLPLGGSKDGGAAEEFAGGVRLHPPPLHRLPPGVGGAIHRQGRVGTWGALLGFGEGAWGPPGLLERDFEVDAGCLYMGWGWAGRVRGAAKRTVRCLLCWGTWSCPPPMGGPGMEELMELLGDLL